MKRLVVVASVFAACMFLVQTTGFARQPLSRAAPSYGSSHHLHGTLGLSMATAVQTPGTYRSFSYQPAAESSEVTVEAAAQPAQSVATRRAYRSFSYNPLFGSLSNGMGMRASSGHHRASLSRAAPSYGSQH